jgi:hypothetical protein
LPLLLSKVKTAGIPKNGILASATRTVLRSHDSLIKLSAKTQRDDL